MSGNAVLIGAMIIENWTKPDGNSITTCGMGQAGGGLRPTRPESERSKIECMPIADGADGIASTGKILTMPVAD